MGAGRRGGRACPTTSPAAGRRGVLVLIEAVALLGAARCPDRRSRSAGKPDERRPRRCSRRRSRCSAALLLAFGARGLRRCDRRPAPRSSCCSCWRCRCRYSLAFQADRPGYGAPILLVALAVLYLLFTPPARAALDREPPS